MTRTLTALFDTRADAETARDRLQSCPGVLSVQIHDQSSTGYSADRYSTRDDRGFWAELKDMFLPDEDRHTYEEGVRRGGALLIAETDESGATPALRILDELDAVDVDQRASEWRSSGWDYDAQATATRAPATTGRDQSAFFGNDQDERGEQRVPIVEEELRVGKREVERGGVRVRSYVVETPVHEDVNLREEHVSIERRPVDRAVSAGDDAFRERTVEMAETAEEAVVQKEARVREELVIRKDVEHRSQSIDDTVRHTEVEVDDNAGTTRTGGSTLDRDRI